MHSRYCVSGAKTVVFENGEEESDSLGTVYLREHGERMKSEPRAKEIGPPGWDRYLKDLAPINPRVLETLAPTEALSFYIATRDSAIRGSLPSLDAEIRVQAKAEGKAVQALETDKDRQAVWQLAAESVKRLSLEEFRKIFQGDPTAYYLDQLRKEYELMATYKQRTPDDIRKFVALDGRYGQILLGDRNRLWLPRLEKILAEGDAFVAVGIAHLVGPDNLIEALSKQGYAFKYTQECTAFAAR